MGKKQQHMSEFVSLLCYYYISEFEFLHSASLIIKIQIEVISSGLTTINRKVLCIVVLF